MKFFREIFIQNFLLCRHESGLLKDKIVDLYQQLEMFLRSDHFGEDQRKILQITYPDLVRDLQGKRKEIETMENKVIIAGIV